MSTNLIRQSDPTFKIFSMAMKAVEGNDGKYLTCTASSSVEDLHGDTITDECVRDMASQAKAKAMTIFLNHRYAVPEDVMGSTTDTRSISRSQDANGKAIWDMDLDLKVNETNPRAVNTYAAIKDAGVKLGVSIGANIEEWEFKDAEKGWWGGLIIKKVNLLEASVVGIPANPRSWVTNGVRALKAAYNVTEADEHQTDAAGELETKIHHMNFFLDGKDVTDQVTASTSISMEGWTIAGIDELLIAESSVENGDTTTITLTPKEGLASEDDTEAADEAAEETDEAPEGDAAESEEEESAEKAEAPTSTVDLEAAKAAATSSESESGDPSTLKTLILSLVESLESVQQERDAALAEIGKKDALLAEAAEIISIVATTPLGRKTALAQPTADFRTRYAGIYDQEFVKLLERD